MTPISILKAVGLKFVFAFKHPSEVGHVAGEVVVGLQPLADLVLAASIPWAVPLYNEAVSLIKNTEIASAVATNGASGTGLAKAAFVMQQLEPIALKLLKDHGVANPTQAQIERYVTGAWMTMDAFSLEEGAKPTP
ncbi:MAG TPA: hypothetical protein VGP83_17030 [Pyrinomonadaceae bacterium]|jgi:hypothetical protein|nr:hypothetical protein [Pyrinomonadaceae bacterium]